MYSQSEMTCNFLSLIYSLLATSFCFMALFLQNCSRRSIELTFSMSIQSLYLLIWLRQQGSGSLNQAANRDDLWRISGRPFRQSLVTRSPIFISVMGHAKEQAITFSSSVLLGAKRKGIILMLAQSLWLMKDPSSSVTYQHEDSSSFSVLASLQHPASRKMELQIASSWSSPSSSSCLKLCLLTNSRSSTYWPTSPRLTIYLSFTSTGTSTKRQIRLGRLIILSSFSSSCCETQTWSLIESDLRLLNFSRMAMSILRTPLPSRLRVYISLLMVMSAKLMLLLWRYLTPHSVQFLVSFLLNTSILVLVSMKVSSSWLSSRGFPLTQRALRFRYWILPMSSPTFSSLLHMRDRVRRDLGNSRFDTYSRSMLSSSSYNSSFCATTATLVSSFFSAWWYLSMAQSRFTRAGCSLSILRSQGWRNVRQWSITNTLLRAGMFWVALTSQVSSYWLSSTSRKSPPSQAPSTSFRQRVSMRLVGNSEPSS